MKLMLNCIVKNEAARITRMFDSVREYIDAMVIVDTGSTDTTLAVIKSYCELWNIPLSISSAPFIDWSQARNAALSAARGANGLTVPHCDYFLLCDADMQLVVLDKVQFLADRDGPSYDLYQHAGTLQYVNRRLISAAAQGGYRGVTHEYLDVETAGVIPQNVAFFIDHADGANRPEKFKRDIRLLKAGLKDEPNNVRYFFYLAQSYRDSGQLEKAAEWYKRRVDAGGWDEEVWNAQLNYAYCMRDLKREGEFIRNMLIAYNLRPSRAEPLYDLAHHYRMKGDNAAAVVFAEAGLQIPLSQDTLFVNKFVYEAGLPEEFSICAWYLPEKRKRGFAVANLLSILRTPYGSAVEGARQNMFFYVPKLEESCPSFKWRLIDFTPPEGWAAMNPSVARVGGQLQCIVRTVNYRMDEQGRYLIRGTDGTANNTNPINTRNYLVNLGADPWTQTHPLASEIKNPENMTCAFPLVIGFEDMRLIPVGNELWTSSTVRQIHPDGNCEQVLAKIEQSLDGAGITAYSRMLRQPRATEKNWAPILNNKLQFMWRLGEVVDQYGATISKHDTGLATGHISGGSQLIPFEDGWLSMVHEARTLPGSHLRYYYHRFAFHDNTFKLTKLSPPFVFNDKVIEFCAGLAWHPNNKDLVMSYGYRDAEARIATVDHKEVSKMLWFQLKP